MKIIANTLKTKGLSRHFINKKTKLRNDTHKYICCTSKQVVRKRTYSVPDFSVGNHTYSHRMLSSRIFHQVGGHLSNIGRCQTTFGPLTSRRCPTLKTVNQNGFYTWLNLVFNKVDRQRIQDVGPDRACAEWLLRVGASVKWKGKENLLQDYNSLPVGQYRQLLVEAADATDSGIMEAGFEYFRYLEHFNKLKLKNCVQVTNPSMTSLSINCEKSLEWLEVSYNGNITDRGLLELKLLPNLKYLKMEKLPGVQKPQKVLEELQEALPNCVIEYPDAEEQI